MLSTRFIVSFWGTFTSRLFIFTYRSFIEGFFLSLLIKFIKSRILLIILFMLDLGFSYKGGKKII